MLANRWTKVRLFNNGNLNIYFYDFTGLNRAEKVLYDKGLFDEINKVILENYNQVRKTFDVGVIS